MKKPCLITIWYSIIVIILAALLYEHTARLDFSSAVFWLRLVFILVALLLTFYVVEDILLPVKAARKVEKIFSKELLRKSAEIKKLREEKEIFMRSALKRAGEDARANKRKGK